MQFPGLGDRRMFDPKTYRIVVFDQGGSGKSTPASCLEENTAWDLVEDIEKIRQHLKINKWIVFDWEDYVSIIPEEERKDMISAYYKRLTSEDPKVRSEAAKRWLVWECSTSRLMIDPDYIQKANEDDFSDKFSRIEFKIIADAGHSAKEKGIQFELVKASNMFKTL